MRLFIRTIALALAVGAYPGLAEEPSQINPLDALSQAVVDQDIEAAHRLFPNPPRVISWFDGQYRLESFEVMFENFKDSERLPNINANNASFNVCGGRIKYIIQYREKDDGGVDILYGTSETPPPPVPFSMRGAKSHCDGVVRYVGGI